MNRMSKISGTISDVSMHVQTGSLKEKKDKEAGKILEIVKKKNSPHLVILTSTSKTHHKSQIGKTEEKHHSPKKKKITVNLQEATIKKLVISKRKMTHTGDKQYY